MLVLCFAFSGAGFPEQQVRTKAIFNHPASRAQDSFLHTKAVEMTTLRSTGCSPKFLLVRLNALTRKPQKSNASCCWLRCSVHRCITWSCFSFMSGTAFYGNTASRTSLVQYEAREPWNLEGFFSRKMPIDKLDGWGLFYVASIRLGRHWHGYPRHCDWQLATWNTMLCCSQIAHLVLP